jgi:hypothetical protein
MICKFEKAETPSGKLQRWICPECKTVRATSHAPVNRICGPDAPKPLPGIITRAKNLATTAVAVASDSFRQCTTEQVNERKAICAGCEKYNSAKDACAGCGCVLAYKPLMRASKCPDNKWPDLMVIPPAPFKVIPGAGGWQAWRGISQPHPKDYNVTAIVPVINPDETLPLVIELMRLQTERPYILLIDTGSPESFRPFLESLRAVDVEVHYIRKQGNVHLAECVSQACDLGAALALTRYTFFTHADCFLRRKTVMFDLMSLAEKHVVAGHQITERDYAGWEQEFGHTMVMVDQDEMDRHGISWKMRRGAIAPGALPPGTTDYSA